jgi:hypothetical protein
MVRRDIAALRRPPENDGEIVADNIGSLIQRVSASTVQDIDRLISDLKILRERLHDEGERVQREIVKYGCARYRTVTIALAASILAATTGTHGPLGGGTLHARHGNELGCIIRCGIVACQRRSHDQLVV